MQAPGNSSLFSIDIVFREKSTHKHQFFVPGEEVNGTAYLKVQKPQPFNNIHLEVVGHLLLKHRHNPGPNAKTKLPAAETLLEKMVARGTGFTYKAKSGDDKTRTVSFPFSFVLPDDLMPSFAWKSREDKPDSQCGGELKYEFFAWMDVGGKDRTGGVLPDSAFCSKRIPVTVVPHHVSNVVSGPKSRNPVEPLRVRSDASAQHPKGLEVVLKLTESTYVLPGRAHTVVSIDNRYSKAVEGLIFGVDEIVTVKFGSKPVEYRT
jgi:hypothetical protein